MEETKLSEKETVTFVPTKYQYRALKWLESAIDKSRNHLEGFALFPGETNIVMATNGFQLHVVAFYEDVPFLKPGMYKPLSVTKKVCSFTYEEKIPTWVGNAKSVLSFKYLDINQVELREETFAPAMTMNGSLLAKALGKAEMVDLIFMGRLCYVVPKGISYYGPSYKMLALVMVMLSERKYRVFYDKEERLIEAPLHLESEGVVEKRLKEMALLETLNAMKEDREKTQPIKLEEVLAD